MARKRNGRRVMIRLQEPAIEALDHRAQENGTDRSIEAAAAIRRDLQSSATGAGGSR
jgi:hypothetical protein